ncbi:hypothetical protein FNV43_RR25796 [Rhamnella rubrinervis]|uniref:Uncharacterized protein n=1 Tax=Rhamnella rubrinervis TaxID=2594499 RepID=A0A8K0GN76_9ROSA|nr:hypothetical protein FNV43_RR25796 [Rhamnella rubrinervis]
MSSDENPTSGQHHVAEFCLKQQSSPMPQATSFRELCSRDEMFFDSHPWLESDCEDYFSVNGDITPSCSNTSNSRIILVESPQVDKSRNVDGTLNSIHESSPTDVKKQLIDLFHESFSSDLLDDYPNLCHRPEAKASIFDLPKNVPANKNPYILSLAKFVCGGETTTSKTTNSDHRKRKASKSTKCCFPSLVRSLSFSERKKMSNPA